MNYLNIFYEEPNPDRWIKYDRYPRKLIRKLLRGPEPVGGVKHWFVNLIYGLDLLNYPYKINDYKSFSKNPKEWALVIGKSHVIKKIPRNVNIIYGPGVDSHPCEDNFWEYQTNIKHILISSLWFKQMYDRDLPKPIPTSIWASGIDTNLWKPNANKTYKKSILVYDKIRWNREVYIKEILEPINVKLKSDGIEIYYIKYGTYKEENFRNLLSLVDAMIFLCEHETQGFAYLQTLSCNIPIMAWDRGGLWKDPYYYPDRVNFEPVTSVPYWDERCGEKFKNYLEFQQIFPLFLKKIRENDFSPRAYILENLTLKLAAEKFIRLTEEIRIYERKKTAY